MLRGYLGAAVDHLKTRSVTKNAPLEIAPGTTISMPLCIGDALDAPRPKARVRITFAGESEPKALIVKLNDMLSGAQPDNADVPRCFYDCPTDAPQTGDNTIELTNTSNQMLRLTDLRLILDY
jgi:hypothetical protein